MTLTEAAKVIGVVITSSPGPTPRVASAVWSAAVHEFSANAAGARTRPPKSDSKRLTFGPVLIQSERSVSTTSSISSTPKHGGENFRNSLRQATSTTGGGAAIE